MEQHLLTIVLALWLLSVSALMVVLETALHADFSTVKSQLAFFAVVAVAYSPEIDQRSPLKAISILPSPITPSERSDAGLFDCRQE